MPDMRRENHDSEQTARSGADTPTGRRRASRQSAAAKVEMHLKVPVRDKPGESLVKKAVPQVVAARAADKRIRIRTIRHAACIEAGHDKFDEKVTEFLNDVGEANVISVHVINYEHFDVGLQKILVDFGALVVYRG